VIGRGAPGRDARAGPIAVASAARAGLPSPRS